MTGLTDVRDRTLTMLRALGVEPDQRQMRVVEKYVRWVDGQVSAAHIDGRAMDREVARGHEIVVTHDHDHARYRTVCHEPDGADCRLTCPEGCESWSLERDERGAYHQVGTLGAPIRHDMEPTRGYCNVVEFLDNAGYGIEELGEDREFEVDRFQIKPVWNGDYYSWERA